MYTRSILFAGALGLCVAANANDQKIDLKFDSGLYTKYVWRSINLVDGPVFQPSLTASSGAWSLNFWGNLELDDTNDYGTGLGSGRGEFTEVDTTLTYSGGAGEWSWTAGVIRYDFPNTGFARTHELFAAFTHSSEWSPSLEIYADVDAVNGASAQIGVGNAWALGEGELSLALSTSLGDKKYTAFYLGNGKSGLTDASASLTYTIPTGDASSIYFVGSYSSIFDKDYVPGSGKRDNFTFGAGVTFGF